MAFARLQSWLDEIRGGEDRVSSDSDSDSNESDIDVNIAGLDLDEDSDSDSSDVDVDSNAASVQWSDDPADVSLEQFNEPTGPLHDLDENATPLDFFHLFLPPSFIDVIVTQTNLYAEQCQARKGVDKYWKPVNADDVKKFLYVNIMFGIHELPDYRLYWSSDLMLRVPGIADVMGRQRFEKINQYFHLNDSTEMPTRDDEHYDPLYKLRPLLDTVRSACSSLYKPNRHISVDEAMIGFNGRLHFKQYIKNKPTKWGIKVWCVAEAGTGYLLNFKFYTGKSNEPMPNGVGHHVVLNCASDYLDKHYCLYYDNYFSSVKLAEDLLQRKTYSCATVRTNRKGWPFSNKKKLKKGDCNMKQKGNLVATAWYDKRPVNLLSTGSKPTMTDVTRKTKNGVVPYTIPTPVHDYNQHMSGVDLADQYRSYYAIGRLGKKWWRYGMWFLIQTAIINAFILMRAANPDARRRTPARDHLYFRLFLLQNLLNGTPSRPPSSNGESPSVSGRATPVGEHKSTRMPGSKKNCYQCSKSGIKTNSGSYVRTVFGCFTCGIHLCKGHCFTDYHNM